jgi:nucleoside-diphosphate-sugar epimerase
MSECVLVTGGSGFIGSWVLRELLHRGLIPVVLDRAPNETRWQAILASDQTGIAFVSGDLTDRQLLKRISEEHQISRVIHLAALLTPQCQEDPFEGCSVNVLGSVALFELIRSLGNQIRGLSYASSYAVHGPEADDHGESGSSSLKSLTSQENRPPSFYGAFKLAVDLIAEQYWRHFGISSTGIRPHVVYGPERTVGLTAAPSLAARAAAMGEAATINYQARLSYDYVEDVAAAFVRAAMDPKPGCRVLELPGSIATSAEFADTIVRIVPSAAGKILVSGQDIPSNIPPSPRYFSETYPDWKHSSLEDGVRRTVQFYQVQH